jgi:3-deoxy-7-phosphoheptulonate synthase/chorismate mutase
MTDPVVNQIRDQITSTDRAILDAINRRLELVDQLWRYKEWQGVPLIDPGREERMLRDLAEANRGPLSATGLAELYAHILDLTKRETAQAAEA